VLDSIIRQNIENAIDKLKTEGNWHTWSYTREQIAVFYETFRKKFGPEVLKRLDGMELLEKIHARDENKDSLVYWLEFKNDEEFPTAIFGSIKGGDALKFGVYFAESGEWKTGTTGGSQNRRVISEQEAVTIAREQRDQLLRGCELLDALPSDGTDDDYSVLQKQLLEVAPEVCETAWGHKYFSLLYPEKLDDFHVARNHLFNLIKLLQVPPEGSGRYIAAGRYVAIAKELDLAINQLTSTLCFMGCTPYRYWRVGTTVGETTESYWELMKEGNYVSIGWRIGDLTNYPNGVKSKDYIKELLKDQIYPDKPQVAATKSLEIFQFISTISIDDLIIASEGEKVRGIGRVTGPYVYREELDFPHCRPVEWLNLDEWRIPVPQGLLRSTVREVRDNKNLVEIEKHAIRAKSPQDVETRYWVEKTLVKNKSDRLSGDYALGRALLSPQRDEGGRDYYSNMRRVKTNDVVLHLTDNLGFTGVSIAAEEVEELPSGLPLSRYAGKPAYQIHLRDYTPLQQPILRDEFFKDAIISAKLIELLEQYRDTNVFYNSDLKLNQGAYLTEAPNELVALLNDIYKKKTGDDLPHIIVPPPPPPLLRSRYTIEDFKEQSGFSEDVINSWLRKLKRKKHIIFQGPPGTGKTYVAQLLARLLLSETRGFCNTVQFHPSYTYEDFIQGIRPALKEGSVYFKITSGRFLDFCSQALERSPNDPCVLIIDEINRANLSRVFGELMYLLEYRKSEGAKMSLAYGGDFQIPSNVYLIGTMNTADRSIRLVDYALRRRFSFIDLNTDYDVLSKYLEKHNLHATSLVKLLRIVNVAIDDPHCAVGVSFFMADGHELPNTIQDIWQGEIEPYLEEYFYDDAEKVRNFRWQRIVEKGRLDDLIFP
jgi:MoxR-like ATPase